MQPDDMKPAPVRTNRFGIMAAVLLFAVLAAFALYFFLIPAPLPPQ
jgi:hypothetical protein